MVEKKNVYLSINYDFLVSASRVFLRLIALIARRLKRDSMALGVASKGWVTGEAFNPLGGATNSTKGS